VLALAIQYEEQLQECYRNTLMDDRYRFYLQGIRPYFIPLENDDAHKLQYVSIGPYGNVLGYFECNLNRDTNVAYNFNTMRFVKEHDPEFSRDLYRFMIDTVFVRYGVDKIVFYVVIGNPVEGFYDRLCSKYGGRIVGTFKRDVRINGEMHDVKYYELLREVVLPRAKAVTEDTYRLDTGGVNISG